MATASSAPREYALFAQVAPDGTADKEVRMASTSHVPASSLRLPQGLLVSCLSSLMPVVQALKAIFAEYGSGAAPEGERALNSSLSDQ